MHATIKPANLFGGFYLYDCYSILSFADFIQ